jgi:hypothetical protein
MKLKDEDLIFCLRTEVVTSNFYFRLVFDKNRDIFDLLDFDFFKILQNHPEILLRLKALAETIELGPNSPLAQKLWKNRSIVSTSSN